MHKRPKFTEMPDGRLVIGFSLSKEPDVFRMAILSNKTVTYPFFTAGAKINPMLAEFIWDSKQTLRLYIRDNEQEKIHWFEPLRSNHSQGSSELKMWAVKFAGLICPKAMTSCGPWATALNFFSPDLQKLGSIRVPSVHNTEPLFFQLETVEFSRRSQPRRDVYKHLKSESRGRNCTVGRQNLRNSYLS